MGYRKIKLDCASVCSDARSRGQSCHCANLLIMLILRDKNSVLILCIIGVAVLFGQGSKNNARLCKLKKKKKKLRIWGIFHVQVYASPTLRRIQLVEENLKLETII